MLSPSARAFQWNHQGKKHAKGNMPIAAIETRVAKELCRAGVLIATAPKRGNDVRLLFFVWQEVRGKRRSRWRISATANEIRHRKTQVFINEGPDRPTCRI